MNGLISKSSSTTEWEWFEMQAVVRPAHMERTSKERPENVPKG